MRFNGRMRSRAAMAACALSTALPAGVSMAQPQQGSIFPAGTPATVRDRMFMRLDFIRANVKTTSDAVRDVSGPIVAVGDIGRFLGSLGSQYTTLDDQLNTAMAKDAQIPGYECQAVGLGSPCNVRARSQAMIGTPAVSIGYYLDDAHSWALEGFVLAKPIDVAIKGDGPNRLNGKEIVKLKMLPPVVKLGHYFGDKGDAIRPYAGLLASYAVFYDIKATSALNSYVGGSAPNDTTVGIKNSFGTGWMLGARAELDDTWHFNFAVGKLKFKTEATIVTHNTVITYGMDVLKDFGPNTQIAIDASQSTTAPVNTVMCNLAQRKYGNANCNLGSFVRKTNTVLDNTLFVLSVGRSF